MTDPNEIAELISENPGFKQTDIARVRTAIKRSDNPDLLSGPRPHGSRVVWETPQGTYNIGLFDAIDSKNAIEKHINRGFTYLIFPIKEKYSAIVNAIPSYLLPRTTKVEVAISPKGTPQVVADDKVLGMMDPSGDVCVILGPQDEFITWFPTSESEEPWEMTALRKIDDHIHLAKAGRVYRISELESYLGGSFDVVRRSDVYEQEQ